MIDTKEMVKTDGVGRADLEARLRAAAKEIEQQLEFIGQLQARGTELIDEARACRRIADAPPGELLALSHLSFERRLQDRAWGPIEKNLDVPDGTATESLATRLALTRQDVNRHCLDTGRGTCCFAHVIEEEAAEVLAESDPKKLRAELVQLGACCVKWIEVLDRRANINPPMTTSGLPLPGWTCMATRTVTDEESTRVETCRTFNGSNPRWRTHCRACGAEGPQEASA